MTSALPFEAEFFRSAEKKYKEAIFLVHFFEGNKTNLKRHIELVNQLGFDAFVFNLVDKSILLKNPLSQRNILGIKHIWADQIEFLLNQVPGRKIIYSFSNPSASAIEAIFYRSGNDIQGLICDSGPSAQFSTSVLRLYNHHKEQGFLRSIFKAVITPLIWSPYLHEDLHLHLSDFRKNFPILSIRGWKDPLIPPNHIDEVFERHSQLDWRKLSLPLAGHLNGLKDFPEIYTHGVSVFLKDIATPF